MPAPAAPPAAREKPYVLVARSRPEEVLARALADGPQDPPPPHAESDPEPSDSDDGSGDDGDDPYPQEQHALLERFLAKGTDELVPALFDLVDKAAARRQEDADRALRELETELRTCCHMLIMAQGTVERVRDRLRPEKERKGL